MEDPKPGLSFRETMAGGFSLGETDPRAGRKKGEREGHELALHAKVEIRDIDRFVDDPEHAGRLTGSVDFTPFGEAIQGEHGAFNLFSPAAEPKLKLMVYELGFHHLGKSYYMAGRKEVRDDPGFDLWSDTTTLFTTLHEGKDKSGQVVGAGVLRLGVKDLIALLGTVRTSGTRSLTEKKDVIGKFGAFFLGELWDSYIRHVKLDD